MTRAKPLRPATMARWFRRRLTNRADSEHEQALIRCGFAGIIALYVLLLPQDLPGHTDILRYGLLIALGSLIAAMAVVAHILWHPAPNPARRYVGMSIDILGLNGMMLIGGSVTAPFYPLLLWVVLGHGFRYGRRYLFVASVASLILFSLIVLFNNAWRAIPFIDVGLILGLIILPAYFAILLGKLTDAISRAEEANRAKSKFLATMSHEFRTPLNVVIGTSDLLGTTRLDHEQRDMTVTIRGAANSLLALVDDVLDIARIEARRFVVEREAFDLDVRLAMVRAMLQQQAGEKGLYLRLRLDPSTPVQLVGGVRSLHQVLLNLVANAIKFTSSGGIVIDVRPMTISKTATTLRFEIHDTGPGIAGEAQERIFEQFAQASDTTRNAHGGTGLGLSIARELLELMGGRIGVLSAVGSGSTFWFELPLELGDTVSDSFDEPLSGGVIIIGDLKESARIGVTVEQLGARVHHVGDIRDLRNQLAGIEGRRSIIVTHRDSPVDMTNVAEAAMALSPSEPIDILAVGAAERDHPSLTLVDIDSIDDVKGLSRCLRAALAPYDRNLHDKRQQSQRQFEAKTPGHLLLAEDNETNQRFLGRILAQAGHRVSIARTGAEAVDMITESRFDLVLMDLNMPEMDGLEAVKMLRFMNDPTALPPIIALSADATPESLQACRQAGFSDYLTKPIDNFRLIEKIDEFIGSRQARGRIEGTPVLADPNPRKAELRRVLLHPALEKMTQPLEPKKLEALRNLDQGDGFFASIIEDYLNDTRETAERLDEAAMRGDARAFRDLAHALKSSSSHIGARAILDLALEWHELDDHALQMRAPIEVAKLNSALERVQDALLAYLEDGPTSKPASVPANLGRDSGPIR